MASLASRVLVLAFALTACASDDEGESTGADTGMSTTAPSTDPSRDSSAANTSVGTNPSTDPGEASSSAGDSGDDDPDTSGNASGSSTDAPTTADESTGSGPTSGPGVLPGESGLEAFCRRYVECGGTYYADQQACIDASTGYWGECASRIAAQDTFGACMSEIECSDWSPDAYNPNSTPCAEQWQELGATDPC
jgi:hypothetical protein